jgi:hypothetical protein
MKLKTKSIENKQAIDATARTSQTAAALSSGSPDQDANIIIIGFEQHNVHKMNPTYTDGVRKRGVLNRGNGAAIMQI